MTEDKRDKTERLITKYLVDNIIDPELPEALMLAIHDIRKVREIQNIVFNQTNNSPKKLRR